MNRFVPLLGLGLLLTASAAAQTTHTVILNPFSFDPATLTIEAGDTVVWDNDSGIHNVNGSTASYPDNPEGFTSGTPAPAPWEYAFTFTLPGTYGYHCDVHGAPGFGMSGTITVNPAGGCDLKFLAADITYTPATRRLCMTVTVRNNGPDADTARLELDYNRAGGPPSGTRTLGSGTLPGGAQATREICLTVPTAAPDGNYNFDLRLVDADTGADCDNYTETVSITAPRVGDAAVSGELFSVERLADLSPSASAVGSRVTVSASPNPVHGEATVRFTLAAPSDVRLAVYDALGREVAVVVDGHQEAGAHTATFDARGLPAGVYVYRLTAGGETAAGRLTLVK